VRVSSFCRKEDSRYIFVGVAIIFVGVLLVIAMCFIGVSKEKLNYGLVVAETEHVRTGRECVECSADYVPQHLRRIPKEVIARLQGPLDSMSLRLLLHGVTQIYSDAGMSCYRIVSNRH